MRVLNSITGLSPVVLRAAVLFALSVTPLVVYMGIGGYLVWQSGKFQWVLWAAPLVWMLTWILSQAWRPKSGLSPTHVDANTSAKYWTPRDKEAAQIILKYQKRVDEFEPAHLVDPKFYLTTAQEMAGEISRHYHPLSSDPVTSLTVPETLAAVRLVADDLERWFLEAVPGSRLLTIGQWRALSKAPQWWNRISNAAWAASVLLNPATIVRYLTSKYTLGPISQELQQELLATVYLQFVRETGFYLIEMNSGRLRGGADVYRRHMKPPVPIVEPVTAATTASTAPAAEPAPVTILLLGQAKAGKSSLVNALLDERASEVDVLPCTDALARYELSSPNLKQALTILDSPGYSETGLTEEQQQQLQLGAREADAILLVMAAHQPAREADRRTLAALQNWYAKHPELRPPPIVAVLTHIDRLSPSLEWSPPYNWREPERKKEHNIRGAVDYAREVFGNSIDVIVPVRTDAGNVYAVREELVPALVEMLGDSQATGLLRTLYQKLSADKLKTLAAQTANAGRELLKWWLNSLEVR